MGQFRNLGRMRFAEMLELQDDLRLPCLCFLLIACPQRNLHLVGQFGVSEEDLRFVDAANLENGGLPAYVFDILRGYSLTKLEIAGCWARDRRWHANVHCVPPLCNSGRQKCL